jgi:hypothetical protein
MRSRPPHACHDASSRRPRVPRRIVTSPTHATIRHHCSDTPSRTTNLALYRVRHDSFYTLRTLQNPLAPLSTRPEPSRRAQASSRRSLQNLSTRLGPLSTRLEALWNSLGPISTHRAPLSTRLGVIANGRGPISTRVEPISTRVGPISTRLGASSNGPGASRTFRSVR